MVRMDPTSTRKGSNGKTVSALFRKHRKLQTNRKFSGVAASQEKARGYYSTFRAKQKTFDVQATQAVKEAQKKLAAIPPCLQPVGYRDLLATVSAADRKCKPSKEGERCIAMPQGQPLRGNHLATWMPCFFVAEYYPNGVTYSLVILRRTALCMAADKRLREFFVVLSTDCFLVPRSFSASFDLNFMPNDGVYLIENMFGDVYVYISRTPVSPTHGGGASPHVSNQRAIDGCGRTVTRRS